MLVILRTYLDPFACKLMISALTNELSNLTVAFVITLPHLKKVKIKKVKRVENVRMNWENAKSFFVVFVT